MSLPFFMIKSYLLVLQPTSVTVVAPSACRLRLYNRKVINQGRACIQSGSGCTNARSTTSFISQGAEFSSGVGCKESAGLDDPDLSGTKPLERYLRPRPTLLNKGISRPDSNSECFVKI